MGLNPGAKAEPTVGYGPSVRGSTNPGPILRVGLGRAVGFIGFAEVYPLGTCMFVSCYGVVAQTLARKVKFPQASSPST